jgi:hypothetical protein
MMTMEGLRASHAFAGFAALALLVPAGAGAQDLTGLWRDNNGAHYTIRQSGDELCWSMINLPRVQNVFCGTVIGEAVVGTWLDLPGGQLVGQGRLILAIETADRMIKVHQTGSYGGSVWTREGAASPSSSPPAAAPTAATPSLTGTWRGVCGIYKIVQSGNTFTWECGAERARGTVNGDVVTADWGSGTAGGSITQRAADGTPIRINWDNGVEFVREGQTSQQDVSLTPSRTATNSQPPQPGRCECPDLSGRWVNTLEWLTTTWTLTPSGANRYQAQEGGGCNASGEASCTGSSLRIEWACPGYSGTYAWTLDASCSAGRGELVYKSGASGISSTTLTRDSAGR